ncbi:hypothetical protein J2852_001942 [Azospirillum soli]|nr:hypothetical protein [Azospirillum soli]
MDHERRLGLAEEAEEDRAFGAYNAGNCVGTVMR